MSLPCWTYMLFLALLERPEKLLEGRCRLGEVDEVGEDMAETKEKALPLEAEREPSGSSRESDEGVGEAERES